VYRGSRGGRSGNQNRNPEPDNLGDDFRGDPAAQENDPVSGKIHVFVLKKVTGHLIDTIVPSDIFVENGKAVVMEQNTVNPADRSVNLRRLLTVRILTTLRPAGDLPLLRLRRSPQRLCPCPGVKYRLQVVILT
jgi:hypothetical protein